MFYFKVCHLPKHGWRYWTDFLGHAVLSTISLYTLPVIDLEASLPQMGSWKATGPGKLCVGLSGLAARALHPDLADLIFAGSQLTEHQLHHPQFALHGP